MNVCILSGTVAQILQDVPGERVLLVDTKEITPQRIVMKYGGAERLQVGQRLEALGHLVMEPVRVAGTAVLVHGKLVHRPAYWAHTLILGELPTPLSVPAPVTDMPIVPTTTLTPSKEVIDVSGPELPWK